MTALTLMAIALEKQLKARGIRSVGLAECEAIVAAMLDAAAEASRKIEERRHSAGNPPQ